MYVTQKLNILQRLSHRNESSESHIRLASLEDQNQEDEYPEDLSLKSSMA